MGRWRTYIKPFLDDGTYAADYTEVTSDTINDVGSLKQALDDTDFDVGVIRSSSITVKLNNISGKYSDAGDTNSIFKFTRNDSLVKVTWSLTNDFLECGFFNAGGNASFLAEEKDVFIGLVNDDTAKTNVADQFINFRVLGREDILNRASVAISSVSNGDLTSAALFAILNQAPITDVLTVSALNITVGDDQTIDDKSSLEGSTVKEAVDDFLKVSNSVLYISGDTLYIAPRTPTATVQFSFFGQASNIGIENIVSLTSLTNGASRIFNFLQWGSTTTVRTDPSSISTYGVKKRSINFDVFTDVGKQGDMLDSFIGEFGFPKQELDLKTRFGYDTLGLELLDRVDIDYPTVTVSNDPFPIVGTAILGDPLTPLPAEQSAFNISQLINYKITRKTIDSKSDMVTYHLREI